MVSMDIALISVVERHGRVTARARATAHEICAEIHIKVVFEHSPQEPRSEARDKVLALLDMS